MRRRFGTSTYALPTGTLGTPTDGVVVRTGGDQGTGYRSLIAVATGEIEWILSEPATVGAGLTVATWLQAADERGREIIVPGGRTLSVRRPGASAGLVGTVQVTVTEERIDGQA